MLSEKYKDRLYVLQTSLDIPKRWHGTPIEGFILSQNFGYPLPSHSEPQLLLATCIEFRYSPSLSKNYAYVVRSPGGRLLGNEFAVAFALARGVRNIVLVGHDDCGMTKLAHYGGPVVDALVSQGWDPAKAAEYVKSEAQRLAMADELSALELEYHRLKKLFRDVHVAPLFLDLSEQKVNMPMWYYEFIKQTDG